LFSGAEERTFPRRPPRDHQAKDKAKARRKMAAKSRKRNRAKKRK
jgi:hypothetical protein